LSICHSRHAAGKSVLEAAMEGQKPDSVYFDDFFALLFIMSLIPLFASGPGKIGNRTIGTAAAGGMLIGTIYAKFGDLDCIYYVLAKLLKYKLVKMKRESINQNLLIMYKIKV
jgi:HAE1 family hydrophobic/amphiphilic exporter-1